MISPNKQSVLRNSQIILKAYKPPSAYYRPLYPATHSTTLLAAYPHLHTHLHHTLVVGIHAPTFLPCAIAGYYFLSLICAHILNVSRRTLQDYRNNGILSYIQVGGKILYCTSNVQRTIMNGFREAYRLRNT